MIRRMYKMFRYYNNQRVKVERYFVLNGVHYSSFKLEGETLTVKTSELSEYKSEFVQTATEVKSTVTKIDPIGSETSSTVRISAEAEPQIATDWTPAPEYIVSIINASDDAVRIDSDKIIIEGELVEDTVTNVIATSKKGKKTKLGSLDDLENSAEVKKRKLDPQAISRCLEGKQKQHKGYTFTTEEVVK